MICMGILIFIALYPMFSFPSTFSNHDVILIWFNQTLESSEEARIFCSGGRGQLLHVSLKDIPEWFVLCVDWQEQDNIFNTKNYTAPT